MNKFTKNHLNPTSPSHPIFETNNFGLYKSKQIQLDKLSIQHICLHSLNTRLHTTANVPYWNSLCSLSKSFKPQNQLHKNLSNAEINNCKKNHLKPTFLSLVKYEKKQLGGMQIISNTCQNSVDILQIIQIFYRLLVIQTNYFLEPPLQNLTSLGLEKLQTPKSNPQKSS